MKTFIEQREDVKRQIFELENENRCLQREIDTKEAELSTNQDKIDELYHTLRQIGQPVEEV